MTHMKDYIFVHIPKTGGRSILLKLNGSLDMINHSTLEDYIINSSESEVRQKFKFTTVRNPFSRVVSLWEMYMFYFYMPRPENYVLGFEEWIRAKKNNVRNMDDSYQTQIDQMYYCKSGPYNIPIDKFLKFENLQKDFDSIAGKLNIVDTKLEHIGEFDKPKTEENAKKVIESKLYQCMECCVLTNEDKNKIMERLPKMVVGNYRDAYESQESIDIVANMSREMINRFNYHF